MTISTTDFGYIVSNSASWQNMYLPVPLTEAPGYWCDSDYQVRNKLKMRLHVDSGAVADVLTARAQYDESDTVVEISASNIADDWESTYAAASTMADYPVGVALPNTMAATKAPRFSWGWWRFKKASLGADVEVNGIEIGAVHDDSYADDDVELMVRSGANVQHAAKLSLSSWGVARGVVESLNRLIYSGGGDDSAWRISVPLLGGR